MGSIFMSGWKYPIMAREKMRWIRQYFILCLIHKSYRERAGGCVGWRYKLGNNREKERERER
jgi:hypothetical protein